MPTIDQNVEAWNRDYHWDQKGDEWSQVWGGAAPQWYGSIYPRIHAFIPTGTVLEIAPGFGRWTRFLLNQCERLILLDLSERCIEECKDRFRHENHLSYYCNDGKSLEMIPDSSVDFVFCYDSLVHAEADVLEAYALQLGQKLTPDGVGFIHHSNLGSFVDPETGELPPDIENPNWRAKSMTHVLFEEYCRRAGLQCISQEIVNWGVDTLTDCFSVFTRFGSKWSRPNVVHQNPNFMKEAHQIAAIAPLYNF